jgi:hypothetical protein
VVGIALFAVLATRNDGSGRPAAHAPTATTTSSGVAATSSAPTDQPKVTGASLADPDRALSFLAGAASDLAAVTSYDYRHLDDALSVGLSVTTGAYRTAYQQALTGPVADDARAHHVVQSFQELAAGIGAIDASGTDAKVLVFGLQSRTDDTAGGTHSTVVTLTATIRHSGDAYLISALDTSGSNAGLPPGSPDLTYAAEAARAEVVNSLSYTRTDFGADLQRALDGAIDPLRGQLAHTAHATKQAITDGGYDLTGTVTAVAVRSAEGNRVELLVAATGYQVADDGTRTAVTDGRYDVSTVMVDGRWTTSGITPIEPP